LLNLWRISKQEDELTEELLARCFFARSRPIGLSLEMGTVACSLGSTTGAAPCRLGSAVLFVDDVARYSFHFCSLCRMNQQWRNLNCFLRVPSNSCRASLIYIARFSIRYKSECVHEGIIKCVTLSSSFFPLSFLLIISEKAPQNLDVSFW
jgi:hypothetical protein